MENEKKLLKKANHKSFNKRAFIASMMAVAGLGLPFTGLANHIYQEGSFSLARHAWMSAHNVFGILFTVFCIWHIILNRHQMIRHLKGAIIRDSGISRETWIACALIALALLFFVGHSFHVH